MKNKVKKLIQNHKSICLEVWEELNELNKLLQLDKFSEKETADLQQSINDLTSEYSLRLAFVNELETLL